MSQANTENSRLSPQRPLGSFHLLRDHWQRRSSFRVRLELPLVFLRPRGPMSSPFFATNRYSEGFGWAASLARLTSACKKVGRSAEK
jgi:hypothetical protein